MEGRKLERRQDLPHFPFSETNPSIRISSSDLVVPDYLGICVILYPFLNFNVLLPWSFPYKLYMHLGFFFFFPFLKTNKAFLSLSLS